MARLAGVDIPSKKRVEIALTYIYGIGRPRSSEILKATGIDPNLRAEKLTESDVAKIREYIDNHFKVEGDLRRDVAMSIKRLQDLGTYRGSRHRKGLPARGQRTKTNSRTRKGPRKTVAGKKKAPTSK
ncbi:MAG: 30S ribosomal protein S13 [bacterium]